MMMRILFFCCFLVTGVYVLGQSPAALIQMKDTTYQLPDPRGGVVEIFHSGCAGFYIEHEGVGVLLDPFLTDVKTRQVFSRVPNDQPRLDSFAVEHDLSQKLAAILAAHCHYDHFYDVPSIFYSQPQCKLYGSAEMQRLMKRVDPVKFAAHQEQIINLERDTSQEGYAFAAGKARVMPLKAMHGPHLKNGHVFRNGNSSERKKRSPKRPIQYKEGQTYAFILEFLDDQGTPSLRMYLQTSVTAPGVGFPPSEIDSVDIAIIASASHDRVSQYPEALLERLHPKLLVVGHWDQFTKRLDQRIKEPLFRKDFPAFAEKLQARTDPHIQVVVPGVGRKLTVYY